MAEQEQNAAVQGADTQNAEHQDTDAAENEKPVTFRQADLEAAFKARALQGERSVLKALGLPSVEEAKRLLGDAKKQREAQLSELEKAQKERDALKAERDGLANEYRQLRAQVAIAKAGSDYADLLAPKIPSEALDDERLLAKALDKLKEDYPTLFVRRTAGSVDGGTARSNAPASTQNMNAMIRRAAGRT